MRLFFAVPLPPGVRARLAKFIDGLPYDGIRWVREPLLHVTMRFVGDREPEEVQELVAAVEPEVEGCRAFDIQLEGFGVFPPGRKPPRVLWVGVAQGAEALADLASRVDRGLARWGLPPENRPFTPHVTLGRAKRRAPHSIDPSLHEFSEGPAAVDAVVLYESRVLDPGRVYLEKARMRLS